MSQPVTLGQVHPTAVSWSSEQLRLWRVVNQNPADHCSWRALITNVIVESDMCLASVAPKKLHILFYLYFREYPPAFHDWMEYASHIRRVETDTAVLKIFCMASSMVKYSLKLWLYLCHIEYEDAGYVSRLFEKAVSFVGSNFHSSDLWRGYINHERNQECWGKLGKVYKDLLSEPVHDIDQYFNQFKKLVAERELYELLQPDEILLIPDKSAYIRSIEKLYNKSKRYLSEIILFEQQMGADFETRSLGQHDLNNVSLYLEFVERKGDKGKVVELYERCSYRFHNYPRFWINYIEYMESINEIDQARNILNRATEQFLKRNLEMHLYSAKFKMARGDLIGARAVYIFIHSFLFLNHPEAVEGHAKIEWELTSDGTKGKLIFDNAIISEKKKDTSDILGILLVRSGHFSRLAGIKTGFDELTELLQGQANLSKSVVEFTLSLSACPEFKTQDQTDLLDKLVNNFVTSAMTNRNEQEELSSFFMEHVDNYGDNLSLQKVSAWHTSLFAGNMGRHKKRKSHHPSDYQIDDNMVRKKKTRTLQYGAIQKSELSDEHGKSFCQNDEQIGDDSLNQRKRKMYDRADIQMGNGERNQRKRKIYESGDIQIGNDLVIQNLDDLLNKNNFVKDFVIHFGILKGDIKSKLLPFGTRLLAAIVKPVLKRHRHLRSWGGELALKNIYVAHDGLESTNLICTISQDTCCSLTIENFKMDWHMLKEGLKPFFTSSVTSSQPIQFNHFFDMVMKRVPDNFISHIESRELFCLQISCNPMLLSSASKIKLIGDLFRCLRDGFSGAWGQFNSIFDGSFIMHPVPHSTIATDKLLAKVYNHKDSNAYTKLAAGDVAHLTPSQMVELYRHLIVHGTEAAKALGDTVENPEEFLDIIDYTENTRPDNVGCFFSDIAFDLCRNIHHHVMLQDACTELSSNVVEPPHKNLLLPQGLQPKVPEMVASPCIHVDPKVCRVLWVGNLPFIADEAYLYRCFAQTGEVKSVKIRRSLLSGFPEGDAFVEFSTAQAATQILRRFHKKELMPETDYFFNLSMFTFSCSDDCFKSLPMSSILVEGLDRSISDYDFQEFFRSAYTSFRGAMVAKDPYTGISQGYGFVKFEDPADLASVVRNMNGIFKSGKILRIKRYTRALQPVQADSNCKITTDLLFERKRPNLNKWVGSYGYGQDQSYLYASDTECSSNPEKVEEATDAYTPTAIHLTGMEERSCEQMSTDQMNSAYFTRRRWWPNGAGG